MTPELRKLLQPGGAAVWLMVGTPVLLRGSPEAWRLAAWSAAYVAFGAALFVSLRRPHWLWLLAQSAAVIALVLVMCDGFEGALLVLVALQLGGSASRRVGLTAVVAQSAALAAAVAIHWTPGAALLLEPPYLGFQLLAFFAAEGMSRLAAARALADEMREPRVYVDAPEAMPLRDPACALAVLRCAQEIATNAARHAFAQNLWIELRQRDGVLELSARDDGRGAAEVRDGNGLRGMRERIEAAGGTLRVETAEGKGFSIRATLPLRAAP